MLNQVNLIGFLVDNPVTKSFESGNNVANFVLATSERAYTTKDGKQIDKKTEFHRIVIWGALVKIAQYLKKGNKIYVSGKLRTRTWDSPDGKRNYITEIFADTILMLNDPIKKETSAPKTQIKTIETEFSEDDLPF